MTSTTKNTQIKRDLDRFSARITIVQNRAARAQKRGDSESANYFQQDAANLERIREAVAAGQYHRAVVFADDLDTAVENEIPTRLLNTIYSYAAA